MGISFQIFFFFWLDIFEIMIFSWTKKTVQCKTYGIFRYWIWNLLEKFSGFCILAVTYNITISTNNTNSNHIRQTILYRWMAEWLSCDYYSFLIIRMWIFIEIHNFPHKSPSTLTGYFIFNWSPPHIDFPITITTILKLPLSLTVLFKVKDI